MPAPSSAQLASIATALERAIRTTGSPGAVLYAGDRDSTYLHHAAGFRQIVPNRRPAEKDTLYDLASLTKVVATTTLILMLRDEGRLRLDQSITEFVPIPHFRELTLFHLITHTSGLVPVNFYYRDASSFEEMFARYAVEGIERAPGLRWSYSDVGFMLLGRAIEVVEQNSLDAVADARIFKPLGMTHTGFRPPADWADRTAATEQCPWRGRVIIGEVHDENTYALGGVSGHAGLFSTAPDLAMFCRALMSGTLLKEATVAEMATMDKVPTYPWQGFGWQIDPWPTKAQGFLPARSAIGHTGWTGTSIWMDTATGFFTVLLSNTCHPSRRRRDNAGFRRIVHKAVAEVFYPGSTNTHTGLDRVYREDFESVLGKRVALLTNHASVDQFSRPIRGVFSLSPETRIVRLYSPEHGIAGQAEAGEKVTNQVDTLPVTSLYGEQKAPTAEELRGVDLFVIDLQDVGARYYTYPMTMRRCMEACARARVPMLILDRPNPLGGDILEGPIAQQTNSDVCWGEVPIRHGMTMGELAMYFTRTAPRGQRLQLTINRLDTWRSDFLFDESALPWIPPSPNIPTPETALLYVGMCLLEGTNLNEGRGTDSPFHLVGAPWLDAEAVLAQISSEARLGLHLDAVTYTPRSIPGKAATPRFQDTECRGIRIRVTDARAARPFTLAVALIDAIAHTHPAQLEWKNFFDTLAGGPDLRTRIQNGEGLTRILAAYAAPLSRFSASRPRLYANGD